ncbi:MAG: cytochrome C oxidase subunit IV family protein [Pirellulaceae bacterium]
MADTHDANHAHDDHGGVGKYVVVFGLLCLLTAISFGISISPLMQTESIGWSGMIAVSCGKAMLVILFFMHLKWEANWKYVLTVPASIMSIFLMLMLVPDIGLRTRHYNDPRLLHAAPTQSVEERIQHLLLPEEPSEGEAASKH